ncbi:MAG TPA: 3-mercaptopyruvate sulfurtransferase [Rhizomicrobium sp.]|jgi:thiosulfate/3-mercaptopyruvate sulfurtransferase|nr:3-mercaptopyruvate sulfurtransferase [Rhizomicrobium sp.]
MSGVPPLVSTEWLAERLDAPDIRVADASWYLPQAGRDARAEYRAAHIPRAVFFDIDDLSDETSALPHMLAPPAKFAGRMRRLGLGDGHLIVVYDGQGVYSSPRAWWMLRAMGHEDVAVLDGGLPKWRRENRPVEDMEPQSSPRHFTPRRNNALSRDIGQMEEILRGRSAQIVDARSAPRFAGLEEEPRPGVRRGHIPGSLNVPYTELTGPDGALRPAGELKALFAARGIDLGRPIVTTCGSGVTAAIAMLALASAGARDVSLYDGSWAEWGAQDATPVAVGPA